MSPALNQILIQVAQQLAQQINWRAHPDNLPQQLAYNSDADIIGYGGQAGGGKTDLELGLALTRHTKSVIFRREATQLRDIIERSKQIIGDKGRLNESTHFWRDLPNGRSLEFGGIQQDDDINKWRGRPHDLKAFDEATEFTEQQVRMMMGWNRSTDPKQKCQTVLAFNPPSTAEGRWVIDFFAPWLDRQHPKPAKPGELRWYARLDDKDVEVENSEPIQHNGEVIKPQSRTFIPASLKDNPYLANTDYGAKLQNLPEPLRSQLLYGDFEIGVADDAAQVIPTEWVKLAQARWKADGRPKDAQGNLLRLSCLGSDIARGGQDKEVLAPRYGNWFDWLIKIPGSQVKNGALGSKPILEYLEQIGEANRTAQEIYYKDADLILPVMESTVTVQIDVIGIGSSVYDTCRTHGLAAVPINWSEGSEAFDKSHSLQFVNLRAEHWWKFREGLDPVSGDNIALPPDSELLADLTAPRYKMQSNGIKIESKEEIKQRIKRSPDCGDAAVLAYANANNWLIW